MRPVQTQSAQTASITSVVSYKSNREASALLIRFASQPRLSATSERRSSPTLKNPQPPFYKKMEKLWIGQNTPKKSLNS